MRPVKSMVEFKQIIGRGTRLFDGKEYFTIYDFVKAHEHFSDPEWDGDPEPPEITEHTESERDGDGERQEREPREEDEREPRPQETQSETGRR